MNDYPSDWGAIAHRIKDAAGWRCERCKRAHDVATRWEILDVSEWFRPHLEGYLTTKQQAVDDLVISDEEKARLKSMRESATGTEH